MWKKIDQGLFWFEKSFVAAGILITTVMVFFNVVTRYVSGFSFSWLEEMTQYIMLWVAFVGAALIVRSHEHVRVDIIFLSVPKKFHNKINALLALLSALSLISLCWCMFALTKSVYSNGQVSVSMTWLHMYVVYLGTFISTILMTFEFVKTGWQMLMEAPDIAETAQKK